MSTNSNRFLRRTLLAGGISRRFLPKTRLAQLTAYLVAFALVFGALWRVLVWANSAPGAINFAEWWWDALRNVALFFLFLLLVRWVRQRFMWSLRRRLFVTYFFIGVIPIVLIVLMALVVGYLFAGQFATYVAVAEIRRELDHMATANQVLAGQVVQRAAIPTPARARELLENAQPGEAVSIWLAGQPLAAQPGSPKELPEWSRKESQRIIAFDEETVYLRAVTLSDTPAGTLAIVSSVKFDPALAQELAHSLGTINVWVPDFEASDQGWQVEPRAMTGGKPRTGGMHLTLRGDRAGGIQTGGRPEDRRGPTISAGVLPAPAHSWDNSFLYGAPYEMVEWKTGKKANGLLGGYTRASILYPQLFANMSTSAAIVLTILTAAGIAFGLIELVAFGIGIGLSHTMTGSISNLYRATQHIKRADFSHRIEVRGNDQLAELQSAFNTMTEDIQRLILEQKEKERLQNELAIAQEVQDQLFPHDPKGLPTLEVHGICKPARTVSGDYYDFIPFGAGKLGIAVGDISGKGISAALMMATVHSAVRAYEVLGSAVLPALTHAATVPVPSAEDAGLLAHATRSPASALRLLNKHLYETTPLEKYATLFLAVYDEPTRRLTYSNAAHLPPLLVGADGSVRKLEAASGLMVGLFDHPKWEDAFIELRPGDLFVAFSDGVIEPENDFGEFGTARLLEIIQPLRAAPLTRISEEVIHAVEDWIGAAEQPDDITLVLARGR